MESRFSLCLTGILFTVAALPAFALPVEVAFRATVVGLLSHPFPDSTADFGAVQIGSEISGSYLFESSREDSYPQFPAGYYNELSAPFGIRFVIGGNHFESTLRAPGCCIDPFRLRTVVNDDDGYWSEAAPLPTDQLSVLAQIRDLQGQLTYANLYFVNPAGDAFSGTQLPSSAPDLSVFTIAELQLWHLSGHRAVIARISSTQLVPEPTSGLLMAFGLLLLGRRAVHR